MAGRELRVLLVEDSEADAELVLLELERGGHDVIHRRVETAEQMQQALTADRWDIVLSDYSLPTFDAPRALEVLAKTGLDIPFCIISGTMGEETAVAALRAGACDFIVKGRLARLLPAVARELRESSSRRERTRVEAQLREAEARARRIIEATNEGVWMLDLELRTTFVNRRMEQMLGYGEGELVGRPLADFVNSESLPASERDFERRKRGVPGQTETRFVRKDGGDFWGLLDSVSICDTNGTAEGSLAMVMDIGPRRALEEQLRQAQKMEAVGSLAGGVAHDFNNILSVILSYLHMMLAELKSGDPFQSDLLEIQQAAERAVGLTRQLLAFSRQQVLQPTVLEPNQIVKGLQKMLERILGEDVKLSVLLAPSTKRVHADPGQLEQILMNLVVNSRDAMPDGGSVTIESADAELDAEYARLHHNVIPGSYVMIAVTDTGAGMDAATQKRMFEPFFTTKDRGRGTGLGLATVFGIVKQSNGHIWVYSEPGKGTTFKVYLPSTLLEQTRGPPSDARPTVLTGTETLLLVEDDDQLRTVTRASLRLNGYNVLEAANGGEAFLIAEQFGAKIHLLVTDVVMPRMSGRQLAERLSKSRPEMRVLFLSGYTENAIIHHGVLDAGVSFLQKPVTPDALAKKVRQVLDQNHSPLPLRPEADGAQK